MARAAGIRTGLTGLDPAVPDGRRVRSPPRKVISGGVVGSLSGTAVLAVVLHLLMVLPDGRLGSRRAGLIVVSGYVADLQPPPKSKVFPPAHPGMVTRGTPLRIRRS